MTSFRASFALAVAFVVFAGCARETRPPAGVFFPTAEGDARPDALIRGTLVAERGCLFVRHAGGRRALVLWHEDNQVRRGSDGALEVADEAGGSVARTGNRISLGGGFVGEAPGDTEFAESLIDEPIPERCRADGYWLAAESWSAPPDY